MFTRALPIARCIIVLAVISRGLMSRKETSTVKKLEVDNEIIEVVPKVCYLADIFSACCEYDPFVITGCYNKLLASVLAVTISFWQISPIAYPLHQHFLLLLTNGKMNLISRIMLNAAQQWPDC